MRNGHYVMVTLSRGGGDDTLEVKYHWHIIDDDFDSFYAHNSNSITDGYSYSSIAYDHITDTYFHVEVYHPTSSRSTINIKEISGASENITISTIAEDINTNRTSTSTTNITNDNIMCVFNTVDGDIYLAIPRRGSSTYIDIIKVEDGTTLSSYTEAITLGDYFDETSPSSKYITRLIPTPSAGIVFVENIKDYTSSDAGIKVGYARWGGQASSNASEMTEAELASSSYGSLIDGGLFGFAVSANYSLTLPSFIFESYYATGVHWFGSLTVSSGTWSTAGHHLPYSSSTSAVKCKTLVTPSCVDYNNDIFYCVGYDGGIYKIQIINDIIYSELINSTWINYAQHINFEFTAIKFHTQYKADGTKQLYMFIIGEEGSYVAPINDITTFGPDAVFTEISNLQAKDILTGNILTDAGFANRLLIINDRNNSNIVYYKASLPLIDKPGVNGFIKIKN